MASFFNAERDALLKQYREIDGLSIGAIVEKFDRAVGRESIARRARELGYKRPDNFKPKVRSFWTQERVELLVDLQEYPDNEERASFLRISLGLPERKLSFSEIGKIFGGISAATVSAKSWRLGLNRPSKSNKTCKHIETFGQERGLISYPKPNAIDMASRTYPQIWEVVDCRWPIGDPLEEGFRFCGAQRERGAYCKDHAAIAYKAGQPAKKMAA